MARTMLLHASAHWKHGIDASMWPMAVSYVVYTYNMLQGPNGIIPTVIFLGSRVPRYKLRNLHVWGCPVFCGLSTIHSSEVPQVLNLNTGSITTQFHVVFDVLVTTVPSIEREDDPPLH